jgi:alpha-amylase
MNNLIWIHNNKATGNTSILFTDTDEYIARRNDNGNPGLVVYINNSSTWQEVDSNELTNAQIKDFTGNSVYANDSADKWVKIQCPPNGYSVWSINM